MKKSLLSLFLCLASCAFSASEEDPTPEELASLAPFLPTSNTYFKVDLSLVLQGIGVGKRLRNEDNTQAHDISFNLKTNPALLAYRRENTHTLTLISSLEYALLYYKPAKKNAKFLRYTGADLEAGLFTNTFLNPCIPFVSPKIVWGKDYPSGRFSQWSLNLFPAITAGICLGKALISQNSHHRTVYGISSCALALTIFEYTIGF